MAFTYKYLPDIYTYSIYEDGKIYVVSDLVLKTYGMSINQFWPEINPTAKPEYLAEAKVNLQDVINLDPPGKQKTASLKELDMVIGKFDKLGQTLKPQIEAHPPFTSLQEMYDTAKPYKKKKGAAKTLGKTNAALTFGSTKDGIPSYAVETIKLENMSSLIKFMASSGAEQLDPPAKK